MQTLRRETVSPRESVREAGNARPARTLVLVKTKRLSGDGFSRCALLRLSFGEFETDFAVLQFQMRGKWPAFFRNKLRQQVGFAGRDQFLDLLLRNFALQNRFTDPERAGFLL